MFLNKIWISLNKRGNFREIDFILPGIVCEGISNADVFELIAV